MSSLPNITSTTAPNGDQTTASDGDQTTASDVSVPSFYDNSGSFGYSRGQNFDDSEVSYPANKPTSKAQPVAEFNPGKSFSADKGSVAKIKVVLKDLQVFTVVRVIFQLAEEIPCISVVVVALLTEDSRNDGFRRTMHLGVDQNRNIREKNIQVPNHMRHGIDEEHHTI